MLERLADREEVPVRNYAKGINMLGDIFSTIVPEEPETTEAAPSNDAAGPEGQVARTSSGSTEESGTTEPTPAQTDLGEAAPSNDAAGPENQVARAASEPTEEAGTLEPTPIQTDLADAAASNADAGTENQVARAASEPTEEAGTSEPTPIQTDLADAAPSNDAAGPEGQVARDSGLDFTPTDITLESAAAAPAPVVGTGHAEIAPTAPLEATLPPRVATATELFTSIKRCLLARTRLPADAAELVAFWVISTWFRRALKVCPCLIITGSPHDAMRVLHVLKTLCFQSALLAGFRRSHLKNLGDCTSLIWEPNLDKRTAALLSSLTDREFLVVEGGYMSYCSRSAAIYTGEDPETHRIQNAIHIHLAPTNAEPAASPERVQEMMKRLPVHLEQYRDENYDNVMRWTWKPSCLASEAAVVATELGRCIVDAPELRTKLVTLLKAEDMQRQSELSNTNEAIVLEAALALIRDGRQNAYAREIAAAANDLYEARGEAMRLRPEHVGHTLKGLGLSTHPLSKAGNGPKFDNATVAKIRELAAMYMVDVMEDTPAETENLPIQQAPGNNTVK